MREDAVPVTSDRWGVQPEPAVAHRYWYSDSKQGICSPEYCLSVVRGLWPARRSTRNIADWLAHRDLYEEWEAITTLMRRPETKKGAPKDAPDLAR